MLCSDRHGVGVILTVLASVGLEVRRHCNCDIGRPLKVVQKGLSKCIKLELRLHNIQVSNYLLVLFTLLIQGFGNDGHFCALVVSHTYTRLFLMCVLSHFSIPD